MLTGDSGAEDVVENPIITKKGKERLIAWHNTPIRDANGEIIGHLSSGEDITARKLAEEQLAASEKRARAWLANSPVCTKILDLDFNLQYMSEAGVRALNLDDVTELYGKPYPFSFYPDSFNKPMVENLKKAKATGKIITQEGAVVDVDGTELWFESTIVPVKDDQGQLEYIMVISMDITERKQAEEALQKKEAQLRQIIDLVPHFIFVKDETGRFEVVNKATAEVFGTTVEDLTGRRDSDFVANQEEADHFRADDLEVIHSGKTKVIPVELMTDSENRLRYLQTTKVPFQSSSSGTPSLLGVAVDITERVNAEAERRRLMAAIEQLAETIIITDLDGAIEYVNPAFEQITGYASEETVGQNISILYSGVHDAAFMEEMWKVLQQGQMWSGQFVNKKKDGTLYTEEATISPVRDASGHIFNYVSVQRDITEKLNLEEQFRQAQKMESIGQLVGGVAHDFNNLLQIINGYANIARAKLTPNHAVSESIEEIAKAGEHAKELVQQLLTFSRQQVIDPVDLNLNEEIEKSQKMLRHMIGEHIQFEFIAGDDVGIVFADKGQMHQVLMNLCVNARDVMPDGGTLTVQTENMAFGPDDLKTHSWARVGDYVRLSIKDTGCGMESETCEKIFDPFFTTKEVGKGTGLGLSTVYGIMKQNEGYIDVTSEVGTGTEFKIYLPVSQPLSAERLDSASKNIIPVEGGIETLLVVEDAAMILELATYTLRDAGYTVLTAKDGQEALRVFEEHAEEIDCVMMDVVMPRMGGKEAMRKLLQKRPALRHLFVSGYSPDTGHTGFIKEQGASLLSKPYEGDALLQKIREVLDEN